MKIETSGIHHITALVNDPQTNVDFYENTLGLRLVKKTVNFDDPGIYHLYFGDKIGTPGTIMTFFPLESAPSGRIGSGQVERTLFLIPKGASSSWVDYFQIKSIEFEENDHGIWFLDPDGIKLGLVEEDSNISTYWDQSTIKENIAIKGFYGAILNSLKPLETGNLLEAMGFKATVDKDDFSMYEGSADIGSHIWLNRTAVPRGLGGAGTIHHIAFRTEKESDQALWQEFLHSEQGLRITPVMDRQYFKSVYFHEPGGILFEIATDEPGFVTDEGVDALGQSLTLPEWLETQRPQIEATLSELKRGE
ncbi:ring-cleaving dioxygenase [Pontibacillus yanchengensis]|uniref:Ring-cleaving dioxygenase n=1 Tax=Pontibacillus yanchengensis TaxID=462910 RepID=A0ACC7VAQ8_9BACI|nr:VOC family protein [Pontibacillus yanchengensis]MYL51747.1 ring-cleaving dioxygenase [Pontibacillus yanchengensis]